MISRAVLVLLPSLIPVSARSVERRKVPEPNSPSAIGYRVQEDRRLTMRWIHEDGRLTMHWSQEERS